MLNIGVYGARGIPSTYSGYETFLTSLLPALRARGHAVTMYCRRGEVPPDETFQGVKLRHTAAVTTKSLSTLTHGLTATKAAISAHHDVLLVVNVANAPYCAVARRAGLSVVLNTDGQEWLRGKWGRLARQWFYRSARTAGRSATALVADGRAMRSIYRDEFGVDSTVIPYPFAPAADPAPGTGLVEQFGLRPGEYLVVGGRLVPENNIDAIVARHVAHGADLPIAVLGAANYESPVVRRIRALAASDPRVRLLGHIPDRPTYFALLRHAARYLHGHSVGGTNPSLVEAMGAGARIAALGTEFNRETLGEAGEFFDDLGCSLDAYLAAPTENAERRYLLQERALSEFRLEDVTDAYERLLMAAAAAEAREYVCISTRWSAAG